VHEQLLESEPQLRLKERRREKYELQATQRQHLSALGIASKPYLSTASARGQRPAEGRRESSSVFNEDSFYSAYLKRTRDLEVDREALEALREDPGRSVGDAARRERLAELMLAQDEAKKHYSRKRHHNEDDEETGVNARNRVFNRKLDRFYARHVAETKAKLEVINHKR
jgi:hypothetical protein